MQLEQLTKKELIEIIKKQQRSNAFDFKFFSEKTEKLERKIREIKIFGEAELAVINELIDSKINELETCDLPDDYCEKKQTKLLELRKKISNLL